MIKKKKNNDENCQGNLALNDILVTVQWIEK